MEYSELVDIYEKIGKANSRLEKISIMAEFLKKILRKDSKFIYLFKGKVVADYDSREFGISDQIVIKAIAFSFGIRNEEIIEKYKKIGDLGEIAEEFAERKKQKALFSKKITIKHLFESLSKIIDISGKKSIEKKIRIISELLSNATAKEAKYIIRTLLGDLRIGVADGIIRDAIVEAFYNKSQNKKEISIIVQESYDMSGDFAAVFEAAAEGRNALEKIEIVPGKPVRVMLAVKAENIKEAFEICGRPAALEYKYDGFRVVISKKEKEINLFTRRLENVTNQFPDVIEAVKKYVKGESFVLDSEVVGYNPKTKKYMPFEAISQRIKRKYNILELKEKLPVEINIFDVLYYNGKSYINESYIERRKLIENIVENKKLIIRCSEQIVTDSDKEAERFYKRALSSGEEGVIFKNLNAKYRQGRRVGYMAKIKPDVRDLDLVIIGAEYGSGKRAGWLTSYVVACKSEDKFLEVGKVSSGLKEKEEEGTSYDEMSKLLKPLIYEEEGKRVKIRPKIIVSVTYQNIQKSPAYSSGYALRFPRISAYRPDRNTEDIANLEDIKKSAEE